MMVLTNRRFRNVFLICGASFIICSFTVSRLLLWGQRNPLNIPSIFAPSLSPSEDRAANFLIEPKSCLVDEIYNPAGVVLLHTKEHSSGTRAQLRSQWHDVQMKCQLKMFFVFGNLTGSPDDRYQNDIKMDSSMYDDVIQLQNVTHQRISTAAVLKILELWVGQRCALVNKLVVGWNITADSLQNDAKSMEVYGFGKGIKEGSGAQWEAKTKFFKCVADFTYDSETVYHEENLFVLTPDMVPALSTNSTYLATNFKYLLMEAQEQDVNAHDFIYVRNEVDFCNARTNMLSVPFIFVIIHSAVDNLAIRRKIRETWGSKEVLARNKAVLLFFLGSSVSSVNQSRVAAESDEFHDIIQENYVESYRQLTTKQRGAFKYLVTYCRNVDFQVLLKADDDVVLDLDSVSTYMQRLLERKKTPLSKTIYCFHMDTGELVPRNKSFKWYISPDEYPGQKYPPYCYGNAYLISRDLIAPIYDMSLRTRNFWVDDVYFTGFVARNLKNVRHVRLPYQEPIQARVVPPEHVLKEKRWLVHAWNDPVAFDPYWFAFQTRRNETLRNDFIAAVRFRTNETLAESVFDIV